MENARIARLQTTFKLVCIRDLAPLHPPPPRALEWHIGTRVLPVRVLFALVPCPCLVYWFRTSFHTTVFVSSPHAGRPRDATEGVQSLPCVGKLHDTVMMMPLAYALIREYALHFITDRVDRDCKCRVIAQMLSKFCQSAQTRLRCLGGELESGIARPRSDSVGYLAPASRPRVTLLEALERAVVPEAASRAVAATCV